MTDEFALHRAMNRTTISGMVIVVPSFALCAVEHGLLFALSLYAGGLVVYYLVLRLIEWDFNRSGR